MWHDEDTSEFMTTQVKLADPTLSEMSTDLDITSVTQFHLAVPHGHYKH